ncbi:MAG: TAXI family TRAP transporter solute-binding subunit [Deltaproteobacteria bacterium]
MGINSFFEEDKKLNRRDFLKLTGIAGAAVLLSNPADVFAQAKKRISIATGGMGGVYFVMGGAIASVLTKYAGVEAAAEVTAASVDNCKLVNAKKSDLGIVMADVGYDAYKGVGNFKNKPIPIRALGILYANLMHIVVPEGKIKNVTDLKGKRVSTGAPGSGTEVKALRVLEAYGLNPDKDIKRERLGASESAGALKDGKVDAYFWDGGVPTSSVLDISATPGMTIRLLAHDDAIPKMVAKHGPVYYKSVIPKKIYSGVDYDVPVAAVGNLLIAHQDLDENMVYNILKAMFDHQKDLVAVHKEAIHITLQNMTSGSPIPYHKGAQKYYKEKGINVPV